MRYLISIIVFMFFFITSSNLVLADLHTNKERLSGKDRFEVAINISKSGWPNTSKKVYIANYLAFADALSASPLAYKNGAPILLTRPNELPSTTKKEIQRLNPEEVVLIGGPASITEGIVQELKEMNIQTERIGGKDRFEVALHISEKFENAPKAILTNGLKFPDAITIAPYAAKNGIPILLTYENKLPNYTKDALGGKEHTLVVGGEGSVSQTVYQQLPSPKRIGGKDRFEVAANIVKELGLESEKAFIATGYTFADALTGSVLAAKQAAPLLLTRPDRLPESIDKLIRDKKINSFVILGGQASIQEKVITNYLPINNDHQIEGYSNKLSYDPGETLELKVHSLKNSFSIDFIRYGQDVKVLHQVKNIEGEQQNYYLDSFKEGADWSTSFAFQIPTSWKSGMYAARLYDDSKEFFVTFIVRNKNIQKNEIAVLASTNTWQAYNNWGGKSLYSYEKKDGKITYNPIVHFQRPNPGANPTGNVGHLANGEKYILSWLERNHHEYSMLSDTDLHKNPNILSSYNTLIISTHSEYWSTQMFNGLDTFLEKGGNVLYLSGNGVYWKAALNGDQIEVKKDGSQHSFTKEKGGLFYQIGRPETATIGVGYRSTGFSMPAPYKVKNKDHWIFADTGLKNGNLIGTQGLNKVEGSTGGASGWETDQIDRFTPENHVLLAEGMNTKGAGAQMIYYDHPGGGGVFSVGSITFGGSLVVDEKLSMMVNNVLKEFEK